MSKGTLNKATIIGYVGNDPIIKYTADGNPVASFSVATKNSKKSQEGLWEDETEWHNITAFYKTAEFCINFVKKGTLIYVEGRIKSEKYIDKQGVDKISYKIFAQSLQLLGKKDEGYQVSKKEKSENLTDHQSVYGDDFKDDEEIPF